MSDRPEPYPEDRLHAATIRSRLMLEVGSELVGDDGFHPNQARIQFRPQGADSWHLGFFASDALSAVPEVVEGRAQFAILNPANIVQKAVRGLEPFKEPAPLRAIATIPSYDQFGLAVAKDLEISTVEDLVASDAALKFSLRGARSDHSVHHYVRDVLSAIGLSRESVEARGGEFLLQDGIPHEDPRAGSIRRREVDVIIDEGIYNWVDLAIESGFQFLSLPQPLVDELVDGGYRAGTIAADDYELLDRDITTLDFSGFLIYTHEDVSEDLVSRFCHALIARSDRIGWQGGPTLPLERMLSDTVDAPIPIPFHRAAEQVWRSEGYLR